MQSNFIRVNKAYCDLTGYSEEELLQKSCIGMSVPEDIERAKQALQIILQVGFIENFEKSCFSKDGSRFTINMSVALMPDKEKMLLTTKNITKEVQLRNALNNKDKEQNILLSLFDKGEANLFKWNNDAEWSIEYASENVGSLLGFTKEEFMSKSVVYASCIHQEDLPRVIGEVQNAVEKNADFFKHQPYRIITKDKKVKWVLDYTVTQKNEEDEITHFIGYITDITEQKLYEEQLKAAKIEADLANESKSQFLASMSHEIRTPMNGILGFLEQLAKTETDPERVKKFDVIKNSGEQLLHIINDILDFSKIESGKMDIDLHPCSLSDLMQNSVNIFSEISSKKNISLTLLLDDKVPQCIMADKTRLQQVVFNLLSNAIKFTPNGGEIVLETKYNSALQSVLINVKDNGIGIANDKLQSIFEAFVQEDKSTTRKFGGTGLGLAISSSLVHLMNSQLQVKSTLGQGSEFYFELPLGICSDDTISPKVQKESKSRTKEEVHVLVVEDNKTNQMLMGMILDDLEITYDMAIDGVEAIKKFKEKTYDIILMDENMPNMNGIEATKHIREIESNHALQHTPIVAVTANALSGDKEKFLSLGMDDYVAKPYSQEDIERVLYRFV
jgi:PAS domain S-box-containing protein